MTLLSKTHLTEKCKIERVASHTPTTSCVSAAANIPQIYFEDSHRIYIL